MPQQAGVGGALPLPTGVGYEADNILKELPPGRKRSTLLCSMGLQEPGEERPQGLGTTAFQNLGALDIKLLSEVLWGTKAAKPFIA